MPLIKKKNRIIDESSDEESKKPRRSSLHVNLSFRSISQNDSLENENEIPKENSPKNLEIEEKTDRKLPKIISIETDFNYQPKIINKNYSELREDILRKTGEYFDEKSEFAIKTRQVLQESTLIQKSSKNTDILENSSPLIVEEIVVNKSPKMAKKSEISKSPSVCLALREDQQIIMSGRTNSSDLVSVTEMKSPISAKMAISPNDRQTYPKKRLFLDENSPENLPQTPKQQTSPILTGTVKKHVKLSLFKSKTPVCSSFVENKTHVPICMEMTSISNNLPIKIAETSFKGSQDKRVLSMDLTEVRGEILEVKTGENEENRTISMSVNTSLDENCEKNEKEITSQRKIKLSLKLREPEVEKGEKLRDANFVKPRGKRNSKSLNSTGFNSDTSRIEGTPLPISRSFMWKSQLKQNTLGGNFYNDSEDEEGVFEKEDTRGSQESKEIRHPALETSAPKKSTSSNSSPMKTTFSSSRSSQPEETSQISKKLRKKKLYPIQERSKIYSLSPVKSPTPTPKKMVFQARRKNTKWRKILEEKEKQKSQTQRTRSQRTQRREKSLEIQKTQNLSISSTDSETDSVPKMVKRKKPRKVVRKKIVIKPVPGTSSGTQMKKKTTTRLKAIVEDEQQSDMTGSSLSDFEPRKKRRTENKKQLYIVTTGFSNEDKSLIKNIVKELGNAKLELNVSKKTTHVVSTGVRTINLLKAILRGCWLVKKDWAVKSGASKKWLNPEAFEMAHFSEAVKENRKERLIFGDAYHPDLLSTCGLIHVEKGTSPAPAALKDLIKCAGGQITENPENADITIGPTNLKENWILDSITTGKPQPIKQYRRK